MEQIPSAEHELSEEELSAALAEKGVEDEGTRSLLVAWCEKEETKAEAGGQLARIELDLRKAKIYRAAGYTNQAWESLEAARENAYNAGLDGLFEEATALMDEIEAKGV